MAPTGNTAALLGKQARVCCRRGQRHAAWQLLPPLEQGTGLAHASAPGKGRASEGAVVAAAPEARAQPSLPAAAASRRGWLARAGPRRPCLRCTLARCTHAGRSAGRNANVSCRGCKHSMQGAAAATAGAPQMLHQLHGIPVVHLRAGEATWHRRWVPGSMLGTLGQAACMPVQRQERRQRLLRPTCISSTSTAGRVSPARVNRLPASRTCAGVGGGSQAAACATTPSRDMSVVFNKKAPSAGTHAAAARPAGMAAACAAAEGRQARQAQHAARGQQAPAWASGETRGDTPPSRSCCAIVHAIRSSCRGRMHAGRALGGGGPAAAPGSLLACGPAPAHQPSSRNSRSSSLGGATNTTGRVAWKWGPPRKRACSVCPPYMAARKRPSGLRACRHCAITPCRQAGRQAGAGGGRWNVWVGCPGKGVAHVRLLAWCAARGEEGAWPAACQARRAKEGSKVLARQRVGILDAVQPNVALLRLSRQQDCSRGAARRPAGGAGLLCFRSNSAGGVALPQRLLSEVCDPCGSRAGRHGAGHAAGTGQGGGQAPLLQAPNRPGGAGSRARSS